MDLKKELDKKESIEKEKEKSDKKSEKNSLSDNEDYELDLGKMIKEINDKRLNPYKEKKGIKKELKRNKSIDNILEKEEEEKISKNNKDDYKILYSIYGGYIKIKKKEYFNRKINLYNFIQYKQNLLSTNNNNNNCDNSSDSNEDNNNRNSDLNNNKNINNSIINEDHLLKGKISKSSFKEKINIKIKTFYNERKTFSIDKANIHIPLYKLIYKMFEKEEEEKKLNSKEKEKEPPKINSIQDEEYITKNSQYRLISCRTKITELDITKSCIENDIKESELLLYLPVKPIYFSEYTKGHNCFLSQEGQIGTKKNTDSPYYLMVNIGYTSGRHYFEVNLLTDPIARSVMVGVSTKRNPSDINDNSIKSYYGYIVSDSKKTSYYNGKEEDFDYCKETATINDIIGCLFEFKKDGVEISFYKNKICLGVAFSQVDATKTYFPMVCLGLVGTKVQISNQIDFP